MSDGYIVMLEPQENVVGPNTINIVRYGKVQTSLDITIYDYDAAEHEWLQNMVASVTTADMTGKEKLTAICSYVKTHFTYYGSDGNLMAMTTRDYGAYWESMEVDCIGATNIMIESARLLGYEAEATYAGYLNHHYATVYIDGEECKFDANPVEYPQVDRYSVKQLTWDTCQWK